MAGTLYIVATPIGNLEDITLRALKVLGEVDVIAAEDTRHSARLLNHYGIKKPLMSYWGEREKVKAGEVLARLRAGQSVALVSDAGTPGISDPGGVLVEKAAAEGVEIIPIPGPSALAAALSVSGIPLHGFTFIGFLPPKEGHRRKALEDLKAEQRTLVFYEAPHRIMEAVADMASILGDRRAVLVREITKLHEEVIRGTLPGINVKLENSTIAGEYVVIVEGRVAGAGTPDEALEEVRLLMKRGKGRKEAVKVVAEQYGLSRKELYDRSLAL